MDPSMNDHETKLTIAYALLTGCYIALMAIMALTCWSVCR